MLENDILNKELLLQILDETTNAVGLCDKDGKIFYVNSSFVNLFGYNHKEEILNKTPFDFHPKEEIERNNITIANLLKAENFNKELKALKKNGEIFYVQLTAKSLKDNSGNPYCVMGCFEDITKRISLDINFVKQKNFYKLISELAYDLLKSDKINIDRVIDNMLYQLTKYFEVERGLFFKINHDKKIISTKHEYSIEKEKAILQSLQNIPIDETPWWMKNILNNKIMNIYNIETIPEEGKNIKNYLKQYNVKSVLVVPVKKDEVVLGYIELNSLKKHKIWENEEIKMLRFLSDVLAASFKRFSIEKKLIETKNRFKSVLDNMNDVVWSATWPKIKYTYRTPSIEKLYGFTYDEFSNDSNLWYKVIHDEDKYLVEDYFEKLKRNYINEVEYRIIKKDRTTRWVKDRSKLIFNDKGIPYRIDGSITDITEKKYELEVKNLISDVSSSLLNVSVNNFHNVVNKSLKKIGMFFDVDRAYYFIFSDNLKYMTNTHEWCNKGIKSEKDSMNKVLTNKYPWWINQLKNKELINIPDVNLMPEEGKKEKEEHKRQGIKSIICCPVIKNKELVGYFGFDSVYKLKFNLNKVKSNKIAI